MLANDQLMAFAATAEPSKCRRFYEDVLGLELVADEPYALVFKTRNAVLRIAKLDSLAPPPYTVLGWIVDDISAAVAELKQRGVRFQHYEGLPQNDQGVMAFPDGTRVTWFKDPDGNTLSLTELGVPIPP